MLTLLAADLEQERSVGPTVKEKLAEISKSRFRQKMPGSKLKRKIDKYPVPENCRDVSPPILNSELTDMGYVDRTTKKSDARLVNVQTMLSAATSCLLVETNSLHEYATDLAGQISDGTAHAASASERALTRANQTLATCYSWNGTTGNQSPQKMFDSVSAPERYCFHLSKRRSPCKRQTV